MPSSRLRPATSKQERDPEDEATVPNSVQARIVARLRPSLKLIGLCGCADGDAQPGDAVRVLLWPDEDTARAQLGLELHWLGEVAEDVVGAARPVDDALLVQVPLECGPGYGVVLLHVVKDVLRGGHGGADGDDRELVHVVGATDATERAYVVLGTQEVPKPERGDAPRLGEGARHEHDGAVWREEGDLDHVRLRDGRARRIVRVAQHDERRLVVDCRDHFICREAALAREEGPLDDEVLGEGRLLVHGESRRGDDGLGAAGAASTDDEVDPLIGAVCEHALIGGHAGVLGNVLVQVAVGRVALQALGGHVLGDGGGDMLGHGDGPLVKVEQDVLVRRAPVERRLVRRQLTQVRLEDRVRLAVAAVFARRGKEFERGGVDRRVGSGDDAAVREAVTLKRERLAAPVGHQTARAKDHRHERRVVVHAQVGLHDQVGAEAGR
eukprot:6211785-Pleurochrysis_carterae.AAC.3